MELAITGGQVLLPGEGLCRTDLFTAGSAIVAGNPGGRRFDARGLLVLPGIVDLHGDAFERQVQPRPGVNFPVPLALADTEAQLLANGITTAFHGVTLSWEPGLRSVAMWQALLGALAAHPAGGCDMRVHMRWEAFNLAALEVAQAGIVAGQVHLLAFNDHTPSILHKMQDPVQGAKFSERAGLSLEAFRAVAEQAASRAAEVVPGQARLAAAARRAGLPMASHDDASVAARDGFRSLGARICEFPTTEAVARHATACGDWVLMGSPNVVRGGSHLGWASAARMVEAGLCRVLTSDYYYPALLQAPFLLAAGGRVGLPAAWELVSANPAAAAGLADRGHLAAGARADLLLVTPGPAPRVVATMVAGNLVHLAVGAADRLG